MQTALTVAARRLPIEMTIPPSFRKVNPGDFAIMLFSLVSSTLPMSLVDDYGEITLAQQISQLPGIAQVLVFGRAEIRRPRPGRSGRRSNARHLPGRCPHRPRKDQFEYAGRHHLRPEADQNTTIDASAAMRHAAEYGDVVAAYRNGAADQAQRDRQGDRITSRTTLAANYLQE